MDEQSFVFQDPDCYCGEVKNVLPLLRSCLHRVRSILESYDWQLQIKEAKEYIVEKDEEDPDLFGFCVEYLYRDQLILSRKLQHYSEFVTLARLYAMGERLLALKF
jgi:hypothetical protein